MFNFPSLPLDPLVTTYVSSSSRSTSPERFPTSFPCPGIPQFNCRRCDVVCLSHTDLLTHIRSAHYLGCNQCGFKCPNTTILATPVKKQHTKSHVCHICNMSFKRRYHLTRHVGTHKKSVACPRCPKIFSSKEQLQAHMNVH